MSTAGGLSTSVGRAQALGAECMQIFLSAPQRWQAPRHSEAEVAEFTRLVTAAAIGPNFAHASYLINLASDDPALRQRSIDSLSAAAAWADRIGLAGVVVHVGSGRNQPVADAERQVSTALAEVLRAPSSSAILLENSAGSGETLGARFAQIGALVDRLDRDPRLGLCLDTAHTFASGYDLRTDSELERALDEIEQSIGLDRLRLIHANDSRAGLASAVDRHENIGRGYLGEQTFTRLLAQPVLAGLPWVLEVPGYEDKGPDLPNMSLLRRLAGRPTVDSD
ncbi:MAG: deoxyribonuclease IV [Chloroflexota bacterium]|nr:deoxyribonuclease IV [Chloroflexota bacterium]